MIRMKISSILVFFLLVRSFNGYRDVFGLVLRKNGQFGVEHIKMKSGDLFIKDFGQFVNSISVFV